MDWRQDEAALTRLRIENMLQPETLQKIPKGKWPVRGPSDLIEVWRSKRFLVQVFSEMRGIERLSVCRTDVEDKSGRWQEGIGWDDLQEVKRQCGRGDKDAVEIFPKDDDVVNVANMRHLWVLPDRLAFAWRKRRIKVEGATQ